MKRFGLLGRTLEHSFSPRIHALLGDYDYELFALEEREIPELLSRADLGGINVTIPYKKSVMSFCQTISDNGRDEYKIRKTLIDNNKVEAIIVLPCEMFYSTDISVTLWIINNNKKARELNGRTLRNREGRILFVDLRQAVSTAPDSWYCQSEYPTK